MIPLGGSGPDSILNGDWPLKARSLGLRWRSAERLAGDLERLLGSLEGPSRTFAGVHSSQTALCHWPGFHEP